MLLVGASGQVGQACARAFAAAGWEVVGTRHASASPELRSLDLADEPALRAAVREVAPSVCVVAAGMTNVERCEAEPALAEALNARAPAVLASACAAVGARPVYLSTEYLFDGTAGPYREEDPPHPISAYGRSKRAGEQAVLAAPGGLSVRTTVVYSWQPGGMNFVMQLLATLGAGRRMRVPADQRSSPTYAPDLGEAIRLLVEAGATGPVNAVGPEVLDRHAFALLAARVLGLDASLLDPVETAALGQRAARPLRAGLRIERLLRLVGPVMRPPAEGLAEVARLAGRR
ncbi:MAG: SDR family oxidoreductase [Deltaproteobacteria bacterium]|nr:SDR family oxidoreductase [Deltaproteobacteria bacterium]